ncbi:MAG: hypothetical protein COB84_03225 [Rhodobacteraceae bacterium]|nr:MAG: hypothetical protein COB84_03225 [Paracoccaceae bacterium]
MTQDPADILQDHLKVVRARFISLLDDRLDELEALRQAIDLGESREKALEQIQFILHKIGGTAGTLGFAETGQMARDAENAIINNLASAGLKPPFNDTIELVDGFLENASGISSQSHWE